MTPPLTPIHRLDPQAFSRFVRFVKERGEAALLMLSLCDNDDGATLGLVRQYSNALRPYVSEALLDELLSDAEAPLLTDAAVGEGYLKQLVTLLRSEAMRTIVTKTLPAYTADRAAREDSGAEAGENSAAQNLGVECDADDGLIAAIYAAAQGGGTDLP